MQKLKSDCHHMASKLVVSKHIAHTYTYSESEARALRNSPTTISVWRNKVKNVNSFVFCLIFCCNCLQWKHIHNLATVKTENMNNSDSCWNVSAENWNNIQSTVVSTKWNKRGRHEWAHSQRPFKKSTLKWKMLSFILIKYEMYTVPSSIHWLSAVYTLCTVHADAVRICSLLNGK